MIGEAGTVPLMTTHALVDAIRVSTSLLAVATVVVVVRALRPLAGAIVPWAAGVGGAALALTHGLGTLPVPALVPALAVAGVVAGFLAMFSPRILGLFSGLGDGQWRLLMGLRAGFGSLLLAGGAAGIMPASFALTAGLGDIGVGVLALSAPGSLAAGGNRALRLAVFGFGLVDFVGVAVQLVRVVVPFLAETQSAGLSLMLPWVVVPLLATFNIAGLRLVVVELLGAKKVPVPAA